MAAAAGEAKAAAAGGQPNPTHDKTKQPMEQAMWTKMRPIMHVIGDIADGWERFAKYGYFSIKLDYLLMLIAAVYSLQLHHFLKKVHD